MVLPLWEGVIMAKTYVLFNEEGEPVYITNDELTAEMFTVDFPGTHIVEAEEADWVETEKEIT